MRHRLHRQSLDATPGRVPGDAGGSDVDHAPDPGHGERGLRDVRGEDDAALRPRLEDPVLTVVGEPRVERQHFGRGKARTFDGRRDVVDLPLAGKEDQNVGPSGRRRLAQATGVDLRDRLEHAGDRGLVDVLIGAIGRDRAMPDLDRMHPAADLHDRRIPEVTTEPLGIDGGAGDDHLEIGSPGQQSFEVAEQEVDVEAALVGLVDDQGVVGDEIPVPLGLREQDPVGHEFHAGARSRPVVETDRIAHALTQRRLQFLRDPGRDASGRHPSRLGVPDEPVDPPPEFETDLRQLRGLARSRLAADHDHLMIPDRVRDLLAGERHRKFGRIGDVESTLHPSRSGVEHPREITLDGGQRLAGGSAFVQKSPGARQPTPDDARRRLGQITGSTIDGLQPRDLLGRGGGDGRGLPRFRSAPAPRPRFPPAFPARLSRSTARRRRLVAGRIGCGGRMGIGWRHGGGSAASF